MCFHHVGQSVAVANDALKVRKALSPQGEFERRSGRARRRIEGTSDAARLLAHDHGEAAAAVLVVLLFQVAARTVPGEDRGTAGRPRQSASHSAAACSLVQI